MSLEENPSDKKKYINPDTNEVFENEPDYIDSLAKSWNQLTRWKRELSDTESMLITALNEAAGEGKEKGTVRITGAEYSIGIVRKLSHTYEKPNGVHPLLEIESRFPSFKEKLYSSTINELTSRVEDLLTEVADGTVTEPMYKEIAAYIQENRITKPAKPEIKISLRKE